MSYSISGIILKNEIILTQEEGMCCMDLLENLRIKDNRMNSPKTRVAAFLVISNGNRAADINEWEYGIDQDTLPDWYTENPYKYEKEFRDTVKNFIEKRITVFCGFSWTEIKKENDCTYYLLDGYLEYSKFGNNDNNYANSYIREKLNNCELIKQLKGKFRDKLVPISTNLLSFDGLDDYGIIEGDILAIPTLDLYRECRKRIPNSNGDKWWLATPDSTSSGHSPHNILYVNGTLGFLDYCSYNDYASIRPFFILKN
jgi:hypothetical protein